MTQATPTEDELKGFINSACKEVKKNDSFLFDADVSEWAIAHRLAVYLEKYFLKYHVDCEYNRMAGPDGSYSMRSPKRVHGTEKSRPDIIIHHRGSDTSNNLIVVELKKTPSDKDNEFIKAMMTDQNFNYKYGCTILISDHTLTVNWINKK